MGIKRVSTLLSALALAGVLACGGADNGGGDDGQPAATTEASVETGDGDGRATAAPGTVTVLPNEAGAAGNAVLTIGDESWSFDDVFCAFSPEEARSPRVSFFLSSFGETAEGVRIQLDATIQDPDQQGRYDGEDVVKRVSVNDVEDFQNPSVDWSSIAGGFGLADIDFKVEGKSVMVKAVFNDGRTRDIETVPGTLIATCP